jgi:hypothetical protein
MTNDFETSPEPDEVEPEHPDPEEPETWQRAEQRDAETDELDWADQHSAVEAPRPDDETRQSDNQTA